MPELNKRYIRTAPDGNQTIEKISSEAQLAYHQDLEKEGYTYKEVNTVKSSGSTCTSCES